jgi:hypothetical protein
MLLHRNAKLGLAGRRLASRYALVQARESGLAELLDDERASSVTAPLWSAGLPSSKRGGSASGD